MQLPAALAISLALALVFRVGIGFLSRRLQLHQHQQMLNQQQPTSVTSTAPLVFPSSMQSLSLAPRHEWAARAVEDISASCCPIFDFCAAQQAQYVSSRSKSNSKMDVSSAPGGSSDNSSESGNNGGHKVVCSFGRVLDAGTGMHSLEWLIKLKRTGAARSIWALTGDVHRERSMRKKFGAQLNEILDSSGNDAGESKDIDPAVLEQVAVAAGFQADPSAVIPKAPAEVSAAAAVAQDSNGIDNDATIPAEAGTTADTPRLSTAALRVAHDRDRIFTGNWKNGSLLESEQFEVVVADYLLGSVDAFAPYYQDRLLGRLRRHLAADGRLYFIGMEPWPDQEDNNPHGQLIIDISKTRDACILLAGERPYREYPMSWVLRNLKQSGYDIVTVGYFEIVHSKGFVEKQISVAESKLSKFEDKTLAGTMAKRLSNLRRRVRSMKWGVSYGDDYVIVAKKRERSSAHDVVTNNSDNAHLTDDEPVPELIDDLPDVQAVAAASTTSAASMRRRPSKTASSVEDQRRVFPIDDES